MLVDEFHAPFHSESLVLQVYKKELHNHVEACLGSNLRARLSTALALNMDQSQKEMIGMTIIANKFLKSRLILTAFCRESYIYATFREETTWARNDTSSRTFRGSLSAQLRQFMCRFLRRY